MRRWRFGPRASIRPDLRRSVGLRVLGMVLASVLLVSACGSKEEFVYVDHDEHEEAGHGAYTPIGRSTSPRVHQDGAHHPADDVAVGSGHAAAYAPIAGSDSLLVHTDGKPRSVPQVALANEKTGVGSSAPYPVSTPRIASSGATAGHGGHAQATPSPTTAARLNLGTGLGASAAAPKPGSIPALTQDDSDDELATVAGRVESIIGMDVTVKSPAGLARVRLAERARVDRDALGTATDLKPGQFVGAVQQLGGPASSVRLYATGPSTPRAGIVPMIGSRNGQVTTFGSVVTLQFGGLLLNTGGATTTVTLPAGVEILKPAPADTSALAVGAQIIATGTMSGENVLLATAVRITGEARPGR
jgi:hypothetical protein